MLSEWRRFLVKKIEFCFEPIKTLFFGGVGAGL
jgi:hypothetical protein